MLLSKNAVCDSNKLRIIREQEASRLSSFLELKVPFGKILILGDFLF